MARYGMSLARTKTKQNRYSVTIVPSALAFSSSGQWCYAPPDLQSVLARANPPPSCVFVPQITRQSNKF